MAIAAAFFIARVLSRWQSWLPVAVAAGVVLGVAVVLARPVPVTPDGLLLNAAWGAACCAFAVWVNKRIAGKS